MVENAQTWEEVQKRFDYLDKPQKVDKEKQKAIDKKFASGKYTVDGWYERHYMKANEYPVQGREADISVGGANGTGKRR